MIVEQKKEGESYGLCSSQLKSRFRPNAYGLYAMLGNISEATIEDKSVWYMGGNLRDHSDIAGYFTGSERVPFYGIRFVMRKKDYTKEISDEPDDLFPPPEPDDYSYLIP